MLNPNYTYLIIDTETTGLSIEDDDIIQVGLITFDHNWVITNRYTHYVKPEHFTQDQLKPLIGYITGIDTTQIMSAPPMSQIWEQIQQYFGDNVVIIGHNISFDLAMVGKHHRLEYTESIDTMDVARTLLHYQRSYSLEILHQQLLLQPRYQGYLAGLEIKAHDALSDCYTTYALFRHCMERVGDMNKEYKGLKNILADGQRSKYLTTSTQPHPESLSCREGTNITKLKSEHNTEESTNTEGTNIAKLEYIYPGAYKQLIDFAKDLRKTQTVAEEYMWEILRDRRFGGIKFRRQHPIGGYIADFYCVEHKLVIELDGSVHQNPEQQIKDRLRDEDLTKAGNKILRFTNEKVLNKIEEVLGEIQEVLNDKLLKTISWKDFDFGPYIGPEILRKYRSKGVIIDHNNNVLLMKSREANNGDIVYYELPGGKLEQDESPKQGLGREVLEETGYYTRDITSLGDIIVKHNDVLGYTMHGFLAYTDGDSTEQSLTNTEQEKGYELVTMPLDDAMMAIQKYLTNINQDLRKGPYLANAAHLLLLQRAKQILEAKNKESKSFSVGEGGGGGGLTLPTLKAPLASPKTMVDHEYYDWTTLASTSKIGLEQAGFAASLLKLVHPSRKMIIAFAHRAKLDLAKKILGDHGIIGLGYMRENQYIDPKQLQSLGSQGQRDHDEVSRMLKYCSHHMQGLSVLDHNTPGDFKVYQRVRLHREDGEADIILSTHAGVYAALQDNTYPDHAILFRDHQWWLSTAQKFYQSGIRIDHMINMIEGVVYKLRHHQSDTDITLLDELQNRREIVWGVFGSELMAYRTHLPTNNKGNIECLGGIPRDHMTNFSLLYKQKDQYFEPLFDLLAPIDKDRISRILTRLDGLLHEGCQIEVQSSYQGDNIIISPASTYVDYADFRQLFAGRHVIFTQTTGQGTDNLTTKLLSHPPTIQLSHIRDLRYELGQRLFVLQSNRNQCKSTFDTLMKQGRDKQTLLMGENVTGGGNKLIEQARGAKSYVMVGGYDLYMQTRAADIGFDAVMVIGTLGVLHDQMVRDIEFYAS